MKSNNKDQNDKRSGTKLNHEHDENLKSKSKLFQAESIIRDCILQNQKNECVELTCDNFHEIIRNFPKSYMILFVTNRTTKEYLQPVFLSIIDKYFNKYVKMAKKLNVFNTLKITLKVQVTILQY